MLLDDQFLCNVCIRAGEPIADWLPPRHVFTHPLVRCKERVEESEEPVAATMDDRLAALEARVSGIDTKLDRLEGHIEMMFTRMEQKILHSLNSSQLTNGVKDERNQV